MKRIVKVSCGFFIQRYKLKGWPIGPLLCLLLAACSGSAHTPPSTVTDAEPDVSLSASGWLQIVPAPRPNFDPDIHDYVIDCNTTAAIDLTANTVGVTGFAYLGTTMQPTVVRPNSHTPFRRTVQLKPGQALKYTLARHGTYSVRCLPADFPALLVSRNGTPQAEWYVFAPDIGANGSENYVILTDAHGTPVWWMRDAGQTVIDAKVLDSSHITWTSQYNPGSYYIRGFDGQIVNTLTASLDVHDLQPTGNGTYLGITAAFRGCPPCVDLSPWGGSSQSDALDEAIVEVDQNSNIIWSWRTRDHIDLAETGGAGWVPTYGADIIHMNAVEPDGADGILFSARHLNAVYRIIKSTGAIDWKLGGTPRPESLIVVGDIRPTAVGPNGQVLSGQHDIRRWSDGTISVHDNGTLRARPPSVMRYRLDLTNRIAEVVQEIHDDRVPYSVCCGSARLLPGGNWLLQWGAAGFMTELDPSGNPVLTIDYNNRTFSYRAVPVVPGTVAAETLRTGMDAMYRE